MKGKDTFTQKEIAELKRLINLRIKALGNEQINIRNKMREIGFYGRDDWHIYNLQPYHLDNLIKDGLIKVKN